MVYDPDFEGDEGFIPVKASGVDPYFNPQPIAASGYTFVRVGDQSRGALIEDALWDAGLRAKPVVREISGVLWFKISNDLAPFVKAALEQAGGTGSPALTEEERRAINASMYSDDCWLNRGFRQH